MTTQSSSPDVATQPLIRFVVLTMGYVESGRVSPLILHCNAAGPFLSPLKALHDIAVCLFDKYLYDTEYQRKVKLVKKCCRDSQAVAGPDDFHCAKCGGNIEPDGVDFDLFKDWIYDLPSQNADSWGEELANWWPWDSVTDILKHPEWPPFEIFENAEILLTSLLEPDDVTEEHRESLQAWMEESRMDDEYIAKALTGREPR